MSGDINNYGPPENHSYAILIMSPYNWLCHFPTYFCIVGSVKRMCELPFDHLYAKKTRLGASFEA